MRVGIRWKWTAAHLFVGASVLLFMAFYLSNRLENFFEGRFENRWRKELALASDYLQTLEPADLAGPAADNWADRTGEVLGVRVTLIDSAGRVVGDSHVAFEELSSVENHASRPEVIRARNAGFGKSRRLSTTVNLDLFYLAVPVKTGAGFSGVLRIAVPSSEIAESLGQIRLFVGFAAAFGLILLFLTGFFISRSMSARLSQVAAAADRMATGDFSSRIVTAGSDEIDQLGNVFNRMRRDLQRYIGDIETERDQLSAILNSMIEGVMVTDGHGTILLTNESFHGIFRFEHDVVGRSTLELFREARLLRALKKCADERVDSEVTFEVLAPVRKTLEAQIAAPGAGHSFDGLVVVFHDVTRLEHLERVRRDFVANVSHELRTPLTAIQGYVETLLDNSGLAPEKGTAFLQTVLRHTRRMTKLVSDLLHLSRLESTDSGPQKETVSLVMAVNVVKDSLAGLLQEQKVNLALALPEDLPSVLGTSSELETVLQNLLENAVKYGRPEAEVKISAEALENEVRVSVSDNGIGIPSEDQTRIFERFYRVDKGRSRELGGTGLGLSIVKHVIEQHGGRVWVESVQGQGSTFTFTLPRAA